MRPGDSSVRTLLGADEELYGGLDGFGIPEPAHARYDGGSPRAAHGFDAADVETSVHITPGPAVSRGASTWPPSRPR
ncbi:hypothetical protein [Streptomyces sp.]|uniref:hypothetical protein n=1 Tax=Streptomyces sp. TaxID=1931 RepID=UPI002810FA0A|nr:hypothetical protein [Streptomyces sp.]